MLLVLILRLYLLGHTVVLIQILLPVLFLLLLFIHTITPELVCQNRCFLCTERRSLWRPAKVRMIPKIPQRNCRLHGFEPMIYDTAVMVENMMQVCPEARQVRDTILNLLRFSKIVNKERDEALKEDSSLSFLSFILQT